MLSEAQLDARLAALGLERDTSEKAPPPSKNRTVLCRRGRKRYLVKVADVQDNVGVLREGSVLQRIAPLAAIKNSPLHLAKVAAFDPPAGLLALEWLNASESLHHYHRRTLEYSRTLARQVGRGLGFLHRASKDAPARYALADAFRDESSLLECFIRMRPEFYARLSRAGVDFFSSVQLDATAMEGLRRLSDELSTAAETCLLHGDLRQANLVRVGRNRLAAVVFLDWELSSWGDPARDIGSLFADYVLCWSAPEHPSEILSRAKMSGFLRALLVAYAEERGRNFELNDEFQERVIRWLGASLLVYVYGITHYEHVFDPRSQRIAQLAREMVGHPQKWPIQLWGRGE